MIDSAQAGVMSYSPSAGCWAGLQGDDLCRAHGVILANGGHQG